MGGLLVCAYHENSAQTAATWEHCVGQASRKELLEGVEGSSLLSRWDQA